MELTKKALLELGHPPVPLPLLWLRSSQPFLLGLISSPACSSSCSFLGFLGKGASPGGTSPLYLFLEASRSCSYPQQENMCLSKDSAALLLG